ncbi:MAG TPA: methylmalonyl-CoA epimerase [Thermomicrobiales bacterium]|nr:methylmalonyl-CoA epimerase [Thermomicrobiales bacterium]
MANDSFPHDASPITGPGMTLHHVGIVVGDLAAAVVRYEALGFAPAGREVVTDQGVEVAAFHAPPGYVELISPLDPNGAIARFHAKRGDGMHHAAYRVDDLAAELNRLVAAGVRLIDRTPRIGLHGWRVAFIHPEACAGVLTELVEV